MSGAVQSAPGNQLAEIRAAARHSQCPVVDLFSDEEVEIAIGTVIAAMVRTGWRVVPPGEGLMSREAAADFAVAAFLAGLCRPYSERN